MPVGLGCRNYFSMIFLLLGLNLPMEQVHSSDSLIVVDVSTGIPFVLTVVAVVRSTVTINGVDEGLTMKLVFPRIRTPPTPHL